jgi:N4-gp56 family major capsid protein
MSNVTKVDDLEYAVGVHYAGLMIKRAEPFEIYNLFSEKAKIPKNTGDQFKVGGFLPLEPALAALTEGTKPAGKKLTNIRKTVRVKQYGDYVEITDKCDYTMEDSVLNRSTVVLGEQMGRTFDILTRDVLAATASSYTCQYGAVTATDLSVKDIRTVVKTLLENDGRPFNAMQQGVNKFGTAPLPETFWALASVSMMDDLEDLSGWTKKAAYPNPKGTHAAEFGAIGYTRWLLSSLGHYNSNTGMFSAFFLAKNCYITVDLTGNITTHFKDFGSAGTNDPLDQLATHGWKAMGYGSLVIQDNWMSEVLMTHTA